MVKHIHIYRIISFFAIVVFTLFPICAYSDEIQNSDGDMARQSSQDVIEKQDRDDFARYCYVYTKNIESKWYYLHLYLIVCIMNMLKIAGKQGSLLCLCPMRIFE